jgi:hypothetical protein
MRPKVDHAQQRVALEELAEEAAASSELTLALGGDAGGEIRQSGAGVSDLGRRHFDDNY